VHVHVTAYASASLPNHAVVAVFLAGQERPVQLVSKPVSEDKRVAIELDVDLRGVGTKPLSLDFRIGPGEPGTIIFNGPAGTEAAETLIRITEAAATDRPGR
jgi:hypothetical protein